MPFNLKDFLSKKASKSDVNKTTEGQLANDGNGPNTLGENQLNGVRGKQPTATSEKQLDAVRSKKDAPDEVTEAQLGTRKGPVPGFLTDKQLDADRTTHSEAPVEKMLQEVRGAGEKHMVKEAQYPIDWFEQDPGDINAGLDNEFTTTDSDTGEHVIKYALISAVRRHFVEHFTKHPEHIDKLNRKWKTILTPMINDARDALSTQPKQNLNINDANVTPPAGKAAGFSLKDFRAAQSITEGQLGKRGKQPNEVTEALLESNRTDGAGMPTERRLEKARTGEAQKLTEAQMDDSKSKLVKHRNPEASMGNINKVEEQRIAAKDAQEKQAYKPASETDKDKMFPEEKGKDGLRTAQAKPGPYGNHDANFSTTFSNPVEIAGLIVEDANKMLQAAQVNPKDSKSFLFWFDTIETALKRGRSQYGQWLKASASSRAGMERTAQSTIGSPGLPVTRSLNSESLDAVAQMLKSQMDLMVEESRLLKMAILNIKKGDVNEALMNLGEVVNYYGPNRQVPFLIEEAMKYLNGVNQAPSRAASGDGMGRTAQEEFSLGFLERGPGDNPLDTSGDFPLSEADPYKRVSPRADDFQGDSGGPSDAELAEIEGSDDALPEEAGDVVGDEGEPAEGFVEASVNDVTVGTSKMRQIALSFDPSAFSNDEDVKSGASEWLLSHYPSLFSYKGDGRKGGVNVRKSLTVSMEDGTAVAMFPADAFKTDPSMAA